MVHTIGTRERTQQSRLGSIGNLYQKLIGPNKAIVASVLFLASAALLPAQAVQEYTIPTHSSFPQGIALGPDGNPWFVEYDGHNIGRVSATNGNNITETPLSGNPAPEPYGIAAGPDGALWFTENNSSSIGRITSGATQTVSAYSLPISGVPYGITAGPDGALWFVDQENNQIDRITTGATPTISEFPGPADTGLLNITTGPDNALWFTISSSNKIGRITTAGSVSEYTVPTANSYPFAITTGPDGALWFTEQNGNKIGRIDITSGTPMFSEYPIRTSGSYPQGITVGADGALWFTEGVGNQIGRVSLGSVPTIQEFGGLSPASFPFGITSTPDGAIWFTEQNGNRIGRLLAPLTITSTALPSDVVGTPYSATATAVGGTTPYTWSLVSGAGLLPVGLTLNSSTGVISGTPAGPPGTSTFTIQVTDSSAPSQTATKQLSITIAPPLLAIFTTNLPGGTVGVTYSAPMTAQGGTTPYTWSLVSGAGSLPAGLTLNSSTGAINGTPTGPPGTSTFTIRVTDSSAPPQTATKQLSITTAPPLLAITTTSLPVGTVGLPYSATLTAQGGTASYRWSIVPGSGSLPNGLNLNSSTGAMTGVPSVADSFSFTVQVTDSGSPAQMAMARLNITIKPAPRITSLSPSSAVEGSPAFTLTVNGSGFTGGAIVQWNGTALSTTFVSATQVTASVPANLIASPGTAAVTVLSSGVTSNGATFMVQVPVAITSLNPSSAVAGSPAFTLTVNGSGFASGAAVQWNDTALSTTFVSATQLTASIPASLTTSPGTAIVTVVSDGVMSNGATFTIQVPVSVPVAITALSPSSAVAGSPAFTLTLTGSGFAAGAAVQWNGTALPTTFVSATQLTALVPATLIATAGSATVTVISAGVTSNRAGFTINPSISIAVPSSSSQPGQTVSGTQVQSAQPTPAAISGTVSLSFNNTNNLPDLPSPYMNPGVCFGSSVSCGNPPQVTASFTIPPGSSSAQIPDVQTGTVAGDIVLTVSGQPNNASKITVPLTVPVIEPNSVQILDVTSSGFLVELVGNSSPRDLKTATFTFNAATGVQISGTNSFPVSVQSEFSTWYTDTTATQSQNYGSAFSLQVPFTYTGNISDIQSVTVTLTNSEGTSTAVTGTQ